jgi:L-alanine-DL-glutamate epimerase-like enolase superfamily enzyme
VATSRLAIDDGHAVAPDRPGLGIEWRHDELDRRARARHHITSTNTLSP